MLRPVKFPAQRSPAFFKKGPISVSEPRTLTWICGALMKRSRLPFRVLFYTVALVLCVQSFGLLCDDCMLASAADSCQHVGGDDHAQGASSLVDPCVNSLCSLCGFALTRRPPRIALHECLCLGCQKVDQRYHYLPTSGLFRPPRA